MTTIKFSFATQPVETSAITAALTEYSNAEAMRQSATDLKRDIFDKMTELLGIQDSKESKKALRQFAKAYASGELQALGQQIDAASELIDSVRQGD